MQVIKVRAEDIQSALDEDELTPDSRWGMEFLSALKRREGVSPLFLRVDYPGDGGYELRAVKGLSMRIAWFLARAVELWDKDE
jgi:hypothetical protein